MNAKSTTEKILLRPEEAAKRLGVSRARLYQLLAAGEIASLKIGSSRRVPVAELDRFVDRLMGDCMRNAPVEIERILH